MKRQFTSIITIAMIAYAAQSFAISSAVQSNQDYIFTLGTVRHIQIMIENFGDDELRKKYTDIKSSFREAGEAFYAQDFQGSGLKFKKVKTELISLLEILDDLYLKRTKEILDTTSKEAFNILIEYSKESGLASYLKKPFDPLTDKKLIEPDKYHLFRDREKIAAHLREGYKKYDRAKIISEDQDLLYLKKKRNLNVKDMNQIISSYTELIFLCREAKQNGIEIYRLLNVNEVGRSMIKYNITHGSLVPIYDDRIPEKYKVDANDNIKLIHSIEQKKISRK
jgi:hypothetical protein